MPQTCRKAAHINARLLG